LHNAHGTAAGRARTPRDVRGFALPPLAEADTDALSAARARLGAVREGAPLTVLDRHFKS